MIACRSDPAENYRMTQTSAVFMALACWTSAQTPPNLAGVWELRKSESAPAGRMPDSMKIKIDQQAMAFDMTIRVVAAGKLEQQSFRYIAGQETKGEMHGAPMTSRAELDERALVVRSVAVIGGKELRLTDRFNLSADGNTLTFRERHQYGSEPEAEDTRVFDRRPATSWEPDAPPKRAEEVYKNIQIMKGVPAPRLAVVMTNLTRWLGVDCAHCHVVGQFESDDKPAKKTARTMFQMVRAINQNNFAGSNPVTCWTCHRGEAKPQSLPKQ
jgi:hypothetical protein